VRQELERVEPLIGEWEWSEWRRRAACWRAAAVGGAGAMGRLSGESEEGGRCCMRRWVCCKGERERGPARHAYVRHMGKAGDGGGGRGAGCGGRVRGEHAQVKKSWVLGTPECFFQSV